MDLQAPWSKYSLKAACNSVGFQLRGVGTHSHISVMCASALIPSILENVNPNINLPLVGRHRSVVEVEPARSENARMVVLTIRADPP